MGRRRRGEKGGGLQVIRGSNFRRGGREGAAHRRRRGREDGRGTGVSSPARDGERKIRRAKKRKTKKSRPRARGGELIRSATRLTQDEDARNEEG